MNKQLLEYIDKEIKKNLEEYVEIGEDFSSYSKEELLDGAKYLKDDLKGQFLGYVIDEVNNQIIYISTDKIFIGDMSLAGRIYKIIK